MQGVCCRGFTGLGGLGLGFTACPGSRVGITGLGGPVGDHMGGYQNSDPFLGTLNNRCRILIGIQK